MQRRQTNAQDERYVCSPQRVSEIIDDVELEDWPNDCNSATIRSDDCCPMADMIHCSLRIQYSSQHFSSNETCLQSSKDAGGVMYCIAGGENKKDTTT